MDVQMELMLCQATAMCGALSMLVWALQHHFLRWLSTRGHGREWEVIGCVFLVDMMELLTAPLLITQLLGFRVCEDHVITTLAMILISRLLGLLVLPNRPLEGSSGSQQTCDSSQTSCLCISPKKLAIIFITCQLTTLLITAIPLFIPKSSSITGFSLWCGVTLLAIMVNLQQVFSVSMAPVSRSALIWKPEVFALHVYVGAISAVPIWLYSPFLMAKRAAAGNPSVPGLYRGQWASYLDDDSWFLTSVCAGGLRVVLEGLLCVWVYGGSRRSAVCWGLQ